eukprot:Nk52_evm36s2531 gene=Nk52_evmTU36s2531
MVAISKDRRIDGVDVPDLGLLSSVTQEAVTKALSVRYSRKEIYTFIGDVIVAVNPYERLDIYTEEHMKEYQHVVVPQALSPHIYSIASKAYGDMVKTYQNHCVIISGESGSGKTESSKIIMEYLVKASSSYDKSDVYESSNRIKNKLLESNPVMEAFGNSKTLRNDNSSRFGKYLELEFNFKGEIMGSKILSYLLEKHRVVGQIQGERNFHIFYQLLAGANKNMLAALKLSRDPMKYKYLSQSGCPKLKGMDDEKAFKKTVQGMKTIGFEDETIHEFMQILAAILHLGNVQFSENKRRSGADNNCTIVKEEGSESLEALNTAAAFLGFEETQLEKSLTTRVVRVVGKREEFHLALSYSECINARDAFAASLYQRAFDHLVYQMNEHMMWKNSLDDSGFFDEEDSDEFMGDNRKLVIGLLDIYGFEVFGQNGFNQFCINYCNEKLHQLFVDMTLKREQEEYVEEGIPWVHIEYVNNNDICALIEKKPLCLISLMNEECTLKDKDGVTLVEKLGTNFKSHKHFDSFDKPVNEQQRKSGSYRSLFVLKHYAGDVTYETTDFLKKNTDLLNAEIISSAKHSSSEFVTDLFSKDVDHMGDSAKKRPETIATQFSRQLGDLMSMMKSCVPHYIRCVKPNDKKAPAKIDEAVFQNQIMYLGLLENVKVCKSGFCYRAQYEHIMQRYKMITPETWPSFSGDPVEGVKVIMASLPITAEESNFEFGKTKLFIKDPPAVLALEKRRFECLDKMSTIISTRMKGFAKRMQWIRYKSAQKIQAAWKGFTWRKWYLQTLAATCIQSQYRGYVARVEYERLLSAIKIQSVLRMYACRSAFLIMRREHRASITIQRHYRGYTTRLHFQEIVAAFRIQKCVRRWLSLKHFREERIRATILIQAAFRGFVHWRYYTYQRKCAICIQRAIRQYFAGKYFGEAMSYYTDGKFRQSVPAWPAVLNRPCNAPRMQELDSILNHSLKYRKAEEYISSLKTKDLVMMKEKVIISDVFKGKKSSYLESIQKPFEGSSINVDPRIFNNAKISPSQKKQGANPFFNSCYYAFRGHKMNRSGNLNAAHFAIFRDVLARINPENGKLKTVYPMRELTKIVVTPNNDTFVLLRFHRNDLLIKTEDVYKFCVQMLRAISDSSFTKGSFSSKSPRSVFMIQSNLKVMYQKKEFAVKCEHSTGGDHSALIGKMGGKKNEKFITYTK